MHRTALISQIQYHAAQQPTVTNFLPFLYSTRTILRTRSPRPQVPISSRSRLLSTAITRLADDKEDLPFQLGDSTITAPERAVFERIYESLLKRSGQNNASEDDVEDQEKRSLKDIFDRATVNAESSNQPRRSRAQDTVDALRKRPSVRIIRSTDQYASSSAHDVDYSEIPIVHTPTKKKRIVKEGNFEEPLSESDRALREEIEKDRRRVDDLLKAADEDAEVWRVLEKEAFARVIALNAQMEGKAKITKAKTRNSKGKFTKPVTSEGPTDSSTTNVFDLPILQHNLAKHCLDAMRILRTRFPTSPYALSLIPHIKSLGRISYALGASVSIYNELLYIRWVHYRDMHAAADIVNEMVDQGLGTDMQTHAVFKDAKRARRKASVHQTRDMLYEGEFLQGASVAAASWWQLQGAKAGWARWKEANMQAERILDEEMDRKTREEEIEENESEDEAWSTEGESVFSDIATDESSVYDRDVATLPNIADFGEPPQVGKGTTATGTTE